MEREAKSVKRGFKKEVERKERSKRPKARSNTPKGRSKRPKEKGGQGKLQQETVCWDPALNSLSEEKHNR